MRTASARVESTTLGLDYGFLGNKPIRNLISRSGPWNFYHPEITDDNFPILEDGFVRIGYQKVSGHEFRKGNGRIRLNRVVEEFRIRGLRLAANAVEALWLLTQNKEVGCQPNPLVIMIQYPQTAFVVTGQANFRRLFVLSDGDIWSPFCAFVGVYEQH